MSEALPTQVVHNHSDIEVATDKESEFERAFGTSTLPPEESSHSGMRSSELNGNDREAIAMLRRRGFDFNGEYRLEIVQAVFLCIVFRFVVELNYRQ